MNVKYPTSSLLCAAASLFTPLAAQDTSYNVLFITVDDFRPELPAYGQGHVHAPHMTRLTNEGLTFNRAYVQQAVCQPARANVLTGARPDTTRIYGVFGGGWPTFRTTMGAVATLPSMFRENNYWTAGYGKNFHHVDNPSWDEHQTFYQTVDLYQRPENRAVAGDVNERPPWEYFDNDRESYTMDAKVATAAVQAIQARAADGEPFFIAAGFWKPHLPFSAPQKYWDLYDRDTLPIAEGPDALPVQGQLPVQFYDPFSGELTTYRGGRPPFVGQTAATQQALADGTFTTNQQTGADWGIITVNGTHIYPEDYARALTHGYYATTSFIDAQIGRILEALEDPAGDGSLPSLLDNTIIVLWGDHGMHIGQHGSWPKHTNMDIATRIPFILHHPDMPLGTQGVLTDALMESVDIMPTVLEMAGLPMPTTHAMEGVSLVPLMASPHQTWKTAAFSQYPKEVGGVHYMGYAMRTNTHTYMQWREMDSTDGDPISLANRNFTISNRVDFEELYDMVNDPTQRQNIGGDPQYRALLDALGGKVDAAMVTNYASTQNVGAVDPAAPEAHAVALFGGTNVGDTLNVHYIFADANGDLEAGTLIEWVRSEDFNGPYDTVVGTGNTYTLQSADQDHFVKVRVTPISDTAPTNGTSVLSATAVVAGVGFNDGSDLPAPQSAVYEGFDYPAGVLSSTSAGGRGWNGGWWGNDGLSFGANSGSQAVDFTWSNLPSGYHHTPTGRAGSNGANGNNPYRQLTPGQTIDLGQNGVRYFSFLYRHNNSAPVFEKRFHAGTAEILKLQINGGSLSLISPDETNLGLLSLDANTDYVVVGRLQSVASGNDTLSVAIYKAGEVVPGSAPAFTATVNVASSAVVDRIFMGNPVNSSNTGNSYWDELHIDSNYSAVVGTAADEGGGTVVLPTVVESFNYDAGGLSAGNNGGIGWSDGWFGNDALTFGGNSGAAAAAKSWSLPGGYGFTPDGLAGTNNNQGNTPFRGLAPAGQINLAADTVYFSFLFSHASTSMFEYRFYAGTTEVTKLQVDTDGQLRLIGTDFLATGFNLTAGNDYLVVGRIVGNASGDDFLQVNVYPASGNVPESEPAFTHSAPFQSSAVIDRVMVGIPGSTVTSATYWDELRMGSTWGSVIGLGVSGGSDPDPDPEPVPDPVVVEVFDYSAGGISSANAGGLGWSGGWFGNAALDWGGNSGAAAAAKSWSLPGGYGFTPEGLAATNSTNANTPFRGLAAGGQIDLASDTVYFSFLFSHASTSMFEYRYYAGTTEIAKLQVDTDGQLRLVGAAFQATGFNLTAGNDYLIIGRLVGNASGDDYLQVTAYPASGNLPESEPTFAFSASFQSSAVIDRIMMGIPGSTVTSATYWDELRMGPTWGSVVGAATSGGDPDPAPSLPVVSSVTITGTTTIGSTLTGTYTFTYSGGTEGASTYQWYRADSEGGSYSAIAGATALTYTIASADDGKWLMFGVTPVAQDTTTGPEAFSEAVATGDHAEPPPPAANLILHLTFDEGTLADSSPDNRSVTGTSGFATADGRSYAVLNGTSNAITAGILRDFPDGLSISFWTLAQDGENGMPKNTALGWARQFGSNGNWGDGVLLSFGWNNATKSIVRVGHNNGAIDSISLPELSNWINTWVHWAVVKDPVAGTMEVYRDGQLYSSVTGKYIVPAFQEQAWATGIGYRIGRYNDVYYKGYLDDYRIYDGVLDATAIQTIYQQGAANAPTAFNVVISGTASVGEVLTGSYDYIAPEGEEGASRFQWYRQATPIHELVPIDGATALTYTAATEDDGLYLVLGVTPVGQDASEGDEAFSEPFLIGTFVDRSLQNTLHKLQQQENFTVAFFGGSITDGAGQNNGLPWRTRTENWFSTTYPDVTFSFVNASISGTTSEFGVFRTDRHVLVQEPDLIFVEFAVNDTELVSDTRTRHAMEGIVRKIRQARPAADIVFVYTTTRANAINFYEQDQLPPRTLAHQQVAEHYGIPVVDVAAALVAHKHMTGYPYRIEHGEPGAWDPAADHYLPDHVHPSNLGHQVYGDTVQAALEGWLAIPPPAEPVAHLMPELFSGYDMSSARIIDHTHADVTYGAGWAVQAMGIGAGGRTDDFLHTSSASTASNITVHFRGPELGVYYRRMTTGGQIDWDVDSGAQSGNFSFWHETLSSFTSQAMLSTTLGDGNHEAVIDPQALNGNETLAIAGWLVMGEIVAREEGKIRILPLGDSITYGLYYNSGMPGNQSFPNGYRGRLQDRLQARPEFTNNFEFIGTLTDSAAGAAFDPAYAQNQAARYDGSHQGHSGFTTARNYGGTPGSTGNLRDVLIANYTAQTFNPDIVLLHVGVNDAGQGDLTLANIEQLADDHRALLSTIFEMQANAEVYISTIMWNNPNNPNYAKLLAFNDLLLTREMPYWQAQGKTVRMVDMFAALEADGYNRETNPHYDSAGGGDALHPNDFGYAAMAAAWNQALSLPETAPVPPPLSAFETWRLQTYSHLADGVENPSANPLSFPEGSSLTNLQIFAYGGTLEDPPPAPVLIPEGEYPELLFHRRIDGASAPVILHCTNLMADAWSTAGLSILSVTPIDSVREEVRVRSPQTLSQSPIQFMALEVGE